MFQPGKLNNKAFCLSSENVIQRITQVFPALFQKEASKTKNLSQKGNFLSGLWVLYPDDIWKTLA